MKKIILSMLLFVLLITLAACRKTDINNSGTSDEIVKPESEVTEECLVPTRISQSNGTNSSITELKYENNQFICEVKECEDGVVYNCKLIIDLNKDGKPVKEIKYTNGAVEYNAVYKLNNDTMEKQISLEDGTVITYRYDKNNQATHCYCDGGINNYEKVYNIEYDENGNISKHEFNFLNKSTHEELHEFVTYSYEYDNKGKILKAVSTNQDNETSVFKFVYFADSDVIKYIMDTDENGIVHSYEEYLYNEYIAITEAGTLTSYQAYSANTETQYQYDEHDYIIMKTDGSTKTVYTYDQRGNMLTEQITENGIVSETTEKEYNTHGMLTKAITKDGRGNIEHEAEIEYTSGENWMYELMEMLYMESLLV